MLRPEAPLGAFELGQAPADFLGIYPMSVESNHGPDQWIRAFGVVRTRAFEGAVQFYPMRSELVTLFEHASALHRSLAGTVTFTTIEQQLAFSIMGNGWGKMTLSGELFDLSNTLRFKLELDQTHLGHFVKSLGEYLREPG